MSCPHCINNDSEAEEEIVFYGKGGGTTRLGPFKTFLEASEAIRNPIGGHFPDAFIWAEKKSDAIKRDNPNWLVKESS